MVTGDNRQVFLLSNFKLHQIKNNDIAYTSIYNSKY